MKHVCRRLLTGALLFNVAVTANAQALSAQPAPAMASPTMGGPFMGEISRLSAHDRPMYGKPVANPVISRNTPLDQTCQISQLNQDFAEREASRAQREGAASRTPRVTLAGGPPLAIISLALGIASARKWVDQDTGGTASALSDLLRDGTGDRFGISTGS